MTRGRAGSVVAGVVLLLSGCGNGVQVTSAPEATTATSAVATDAPDPPPTAAPTRTSTRPPKGGGSSYPSAPSSSSSGPTSEATSSSESTTASSTPTPGESPKPSPTSTKSSRCTLTDLRVGSAPPEGGRSAGSSYVLLTFTNRSQDRCSLHGFSGVSFVGGGNGTQLGAPARRMTGYEVRRVDLAPGKLVTELVQIIDPDVFSTDCTKTTADGFRVYPPGSLTAAYVPYPAPACVEADVAQLQVAPVGNRQ